MRKSDVIVIGGGFAGLMAAAVSAKRGKKVTLLTYGSGSFPLNSGLIDILANPIDELVCASPAEGITALPEQHPYKRVGIKVIEEAIAFFLTLCKAEKYPYCGSLSEHQWVVTALGTMKPSCLVPRSMQGNVCLKRKTIVLVGFTGLKDHYIDMMQENLQKTLGEENQFKSIMIFTDLEDGRDLTSLDIARWLHTKEGYETFIQQLRKVASSDCVIVLPQVLGVRPVYEIWERLQEELQCEVVECTGLPPSVNGMRMRSMLLRYLKKHHVDIIENCKVMRAQMKEAVCIAVKAKSTSREKSYAADHFILATGGFYGGGLKMENFGEIEEAIFDIPVQFDGAADQWANEKIFSSQKQPFALVGISTDQQMRPLDAQENCLFKNVFVVGRNLGGYDFCFEQSGNGVALVSAYQAAMSI
ncbi:anaerobic glycerol-3-phosphate dehydrogenase subunit GlpB [Anaerosinus massiliensis]|uniref:anaerobic glycerol-3-phosphate dehydrogenase subunit GlpB n=1 Tax=Massilibacillus massiliensis TaxID=1806837 RepID=UPI000AD45F68|nr:anaerobic glycerol-3-phosphate dehydrogenase subunit GlpB [Massilibacillus massiliensis]